MENYYIVVGVLLAVAVLVVGMEIMSSIRLKERVRRNWGSLPRSVRFDAEDSLKEAWLARQSKRSFDSLIDDVTWYDLDLFDLFDQINLTYSSIGSEMLYQTLREYDFNGHKAERLEALITYLENNPQERERLQYRFAKLGKKDHNFVQKYLLDSQNQKLKNFWLYLFLSLLPLVAIVVLLLNARIGLPLLLASIVMNVVLYQTRKATLERELSCMSYLVQTISAAQQISKIKTPFQADLKQAFKTFAGIPRFGFCFRVQSGSEAEMFLEYLNMMFLLPFLAYNFVLNKLKQNEDTAQRLLELLGELEVACAVLNYRTCMPETGRPTFHTERTVTGTDLYHPLLEAPVVNDVNWRTNTLVTGSNASGKSTYVKSIAINCILAYTLNTTLGELSLPYAYVYTSMAVEDDLFEGDSYFVAEIKSIKRILDKAQTGETILCFIDEILKGTNTVERISASAAVIEWLSKLPVLAFVATHDIELPEILQNHTENVHFAETVTQEQGVTFTYRLQQGVAKTRNAIQLLRVLDYPEEVIKMAETEAYNFDETRSWQVLK